MSTLVMVDGYPLREDDPQRAIHERIDSTLRRCREVAPLHPTLGEMFPELFETEYGKRGAWLGPALERLEWNLENGGERWAAFFGPMVNLILEDRGECGEKEFRILCRRCGFLRAHHCHSIVRKIGEHGWELGRKGALPGEGLAGLRRVMVELGWPGQDMAAQMRMGWTLWRAGVRDGWCWSETVARELEEMPGKQREAWLGLLDANDHRNGRQLPKAAYPKLKKIDGAEFARRFGRWMKALGEMDPPELSNAGLTLLVWLLRLCAVEPEWRVDEGLYGIAAGKWRKHEDTEWPDRSRPAWWIEAYLMTLATRGETCRVACAEALAVNPATASFPDVQRLYNTLLERAVGEAAPRKVTVGVDGFPTDPQGRLGKEHVLLDQHLREAHPDQFRGVMVQGAERLEPVRRMLMREVKAGGVEGVNRWVLAIAERAKWLGGRMKELDEQTALFWRVELGYLIAGALDEVKDAPEEVLLAAMESDTLGVYGCAPTGRILALSEEWIDRHGWSAELAKWMKVWEKTIYGSIHAQALRRHVGWLLLFEETSAIKVGDCWGNRVRLDLRKLPLEERGLWRAVVGNECFAITAKPPAKWMKPGKEAFAKLGLERFREKFRAWFAPFRDGEELKLTVPGRDLLRVLMWYALIAADAGVDEALGWYGKAKWKNQASEARAQAGWPAFAYVLKERKEELARQVFGEMLESGVTAGGGKIEAAYRELCEKAGAVPVEAKRAGAKAPTAEEMKGKVVEQTGKAMKSMILQILGGQEARWEEDTLVVKAGGETYRIEALGSRVTRESDGAVVRVAIPWERPEYGTFRSTVDGHDLRNPGEPNWMSVGMLARVLTGKDAGSRIEVERVEEG